MKIVLLSQVKLVSTASSLFVHQLANQKRLLEKYGKEICLLDASYNTTEYSIPLFFLAVKTFGVQDETTDAISEAVVILKSWNNKWKPLAFMVDVTRSQRHRETFPG